MNFFFFCCVNGISACANLYRMPCHIVVHFKRYNCGINKFNADAGMDPINKLLDKRTKDCVRSVWAEIAFLCASFNRCEATRKKKWHLPNMTWMVNIHVFYAFIEAETKSKMKENLKIFSFCVLKKKKPPVGKFWYFIFIFAICI